jgi:hypothetical protein
MSSWSSLAWIIAAILGVGSIASTGLIGRSQSIPRQNLADGNRPADVEQLYAHCMAQELRAVN